MRFVPLLPAAIRFDRRWQGGLAPAAIVEIITWLSVLQMLHRLTCYVTVNRSAARIGSTSSRLV